MCTNVLKYIVYFGMNLEPRVMRPDNCAMYAYSRFNPKRGSVKYF